MKTFIYFSIATALSTLAVISVVPASLIFVSNPKPPAELLR